MKRILLNSDSAPGLPPAAKNAVAGETDLDKLTPPAKPAPAAAPAPAPVKDDKWLETEISHAEDKLRTLREQKKTATTKPAPEPVKKKTGWECEDLD